MKYIFVFGYTLLFLPFCNSQSLVQYDKNGISIEYPSNWNINDRQSDGITLVISAGLSDDSDEFSDNLNLVIQPLPRLDYTIEEYTKTTKQQLLAAEAEVFSVTIENHYTDNGLVAIAVYNYAMKFGQYDLMFYQEAQIIGKKLYLLTFTSEVDSYDLYINVAKRMIDSFKLSRSLSSTKLINNNFSISNLDGFESIDLEGDYVLHMGDFSNDNFSSYSMKQNRSEYFRSIDPSDFVNILSEDQVINSLKVLYKEIDINVFSKDFPLFNGVENVSHIIYTGVERVSDVNMTVSIFQFLKDDTLYTFNCQCKSTYFQYFYKDCLNLVNSIEFK